MRARNWPKSSRALAPLVPDEVAVSIAGSGDARVTANKSLAVTIAGSGDVVYGGAATLRIVAKCAPGQAGGVQRDLLERAVAALREAGISAPTVLPPVAPPT